MTSGRGATPANAEWVPMLILPSGIYESALFRILIQSQLRDPARRTLVTANQSSRDRTHNIFMFLARHPKLLNQPERLV